MIDNNLNINLDSVTFKGLSSSRARMLSLVASLGLFFAFNGSLLVMANHADNAGLVPGEIFLLATSVLLFEYIGRGKTSILLVARFLVDAMPISVLFRHDKRVLDRGRAELERVLVTMDLSKLDAYAGLNPCISASIADNLRDVACRGELKDWLKDPRRLASAANLMYQLHITEEFVDSC
ncbi:hypothetical protein [Zhongshania marina]|uniref:Uncharacterized protein n=1 Tax=Zhongshania marina TaxID=2304603 RepID=A0A2S4HF51_9GAMM|nr:hypothetical protein [Marortus luteolus]POP52625.1 hypothetical protein C0068_11140 [Marortus luteolus]